MTSTIKQLVNSMDLKQAVGLQPICNIRNMSARTLQRSLAQEGTSYSEVVENWRMNEATGLLKHGSMKVKNISALLGYSTSSNFERAFRRWTKLTPTEFR